MKTFPIGGVHPSDNKKWSCGRAIEVAELPDVVNIPLGQHIGAPAAAKVAKGDKVLTGQLIAEASSFMSANIHSPVSGIFRWHSFPYSAFKNFSSSGFILTTQLSDSDIFLNSFSSLNRRSSFSLSSKTYAGNKSLLSRCHSPLYRRILSYVNRKDFRSAFRDKFVLHASIILRSSCP